MQPPMRTPQPPMRTAIRPMRVVLLILYPFVALSNGIARLGLRGDGRVRHGLPCEAREVEGLHEERRGRIREDEERFHGDQIEGRYRSSSNWVTWRR